MELCVILLHDMVEHLALVESGAQSSIARFDNWKRLKKLLVISEKGNKILAAHTEALNKLGNIVVFDIQNICRLIISFYFLVKVNYNMPSCV